MSKAGRPTDYTEELAADFCSRIALGSSLRSVVSDSDMPTHQTIYNWLGKHSYFVEQYTRAKTDSADADADRIENIAEKVLTGEYEPQQARVAMDAYKWTAGKKRPKKYGDKQYIETKDTTEEVSDEELNDRIAALMDKANK